MTVAMKLFKIGEGGAQNNLQGQLFMEKTIFLWSTSLLLVTMHINGIVGQFMLCTCQRNYLSKIFMIADRNPNCLCYLLMQII